MNLRLELIKKFEPNLKIYKPDCGDIAIDFTFKNGLILTGFTQVNFDNCETDSLEGFDGYIYINTLEELEFLLSMTYEEILQHVAKYNPDFEILKIK